MKGKVLPLKEISIAELCNGTEHAIYEIPIYQRNYAWEKDEITTLIQDVYDSFKKDARGIYFIGTLVSYHKGDNVYEVIDGQQRLTTIVILLGVMGIAIQNKLTYRARKKSNDTIRRLPEFDANEKDVRRLPEFDANEKDMGIVNGYKYAKNSLDEIVSDEERDDFISYFQNYVHIIHYRVPKDIDLNHYFEIMNSRGEQLEKHEIIKARLLSVLSEGVSARRKERSRQERLKFNYIWENCSAMNVYIQQKCKNENIFGRNLCDFAIEFFEEIEIPDLSGEMKGRSIENLIENDGVGGEEYGNKEKEKPDTFQPVINFSNFLLIVLKLTRIMEEEDFDPASLNLDDKELIKEFDKVEITIDWVKKFGYNLLKAKYFLDNYIVHHSNEEDTVESNPWMLQKWQKAEKKGKTGYLKNLAEGNDGVQQKLVHLLSMFEVSFTARQRKNYLFYCLLYLFRADSAETDKYCNFVENLAEKYLKNVYLIPECLNERNIPRPGAFDAAILSDGNLTVSDRRRRYQFELASYHFERKCYAFEQVYGERKTTSLIRKLAA